MDPKKHEIMLDPACGTAGFLISSYKHIIKQNSSNYTPDEDTVIAGNGTQSVNEVIITSNGYSGDKLTANERSLLADNMHGYDISPDMVRLSLVNMYLHGIKEPQIFEYDTLTSEDHWNEYSDVILANPPFMSPKGGIRPHKRFSVQSNRSEVLFVDYIAEHLTHDGRAAVIVQEGIIFQSGNAYKQLRKMLVGKYLVGVISLPAGVFNPYSGVKTSILWLDKSLAKKTDKILFVKIENDGFDLGAQRRHIKLNDLPYASVRIANYRGLLLSKTSLDFKNDSSITLVSKDLISGNGEYNLSSDRYLIKELRESKFSVVLLSEVVDIVMGQAPPGNECNKENRGTPFVKVGNFGKVRPRIEEWTTNPLKMALTNDTLVCVVGATIGKLNRSIDCAIGRSVAAVRPNENKIAPSFLYYNLVEWTEKLRKKSQGSAIGVITKEMLNDIDIPLPPLSIQKEIVSEIESYQKIIDGARQVVENYKPRIDIDSEWEMVELESLYYNLDGKRVPITKSDRKSGIFPYYGASGIVDYVESYLFDEDLLLISEDGANLIARSTPIAFSVSGKIWVNNHAHVLRFKNMDTQKYVEFYINSIPIEHYITGAAQPKLNQKALNSIRIPLPDLNIQKQIVNRIERECSIVNSNRELSEIFEQKIKDWIGKVWG